MDQWGDMQSQGEWPLTRLAVFHRPSRLVSPRTGSRLPFPAPGSGVSHCIGKEAGRVCSGGFCSISISARRELEHSLRCLSTLSCISFSLSLHSLRHYSHFVLQSLLSNPRRPTCCKSAFARLTSCEHFQHGLARECARGESRQLPFPKHLPDILH